MKSHNIKKLKELHNYVLPSMIEENTTMAAVKKSLEERVALQVKDFSDKPFIETVKYMEKISKKQEKKTITFFEMLVAVELANILKPKNEK